MEISSRAFHITIEYTEQMGESLSGVTRVVTLVKPLINKMEALFTKDNMELKT